jgi:hypothetical protein
MSLDDDALLFQRVFDSNKWICPVCKKEMPDEDDAKRGYRIRDTLANRRSYGERIIDHPFNWTYVCSPLCAERVSRSWEPSSVEERKRKMIEEINEDIERFQSAIIKSQLALYAPRPKRSKK